MNNVHLGMKPFGTDGGREDVPSEFWVHLSNYTGKTFTSDHIDNASFGCAC